MKKLGATVLFWVYSIVAFILGFMVVIYIHENWPSLEAPAVFIFLALGIALGVIALRMRDSLAEKITGGASIVCFGLSAGFAIFHGWGAEARMIYNVAVILFVLASLAFSIWLILRLNRSMRHSRDSAPIPAHLGKPSEQAILADAAEPYILYPAKWKIARVLLILLAVTAVCGTGCVWMLSLSDGRMVVAGFCLAFLAVLCGLTCFLLIYRLVSRKPALVVTHLGLIDGASALYTGIGPIWWEEIRNVTIYTTPKAFLRPQYRYLDITPMDARTLLRRQPLIRRFLLRFFSPIPFIWVDRRIPAWMFQPSLETILEQIERIAWGDKGRQSYYGLLRE